MNLNNYLNIVEQYFISLKTSFFFLIYQTVRNYDIISDTKQFIEQRYEFNLSNYHDLLSL